MPDELKDGARLAVVEDRLERMEKALESIDQSLKILARVEYQNESLARRVDGIETDMKKVNEELPTLRIARDGSFSVIKVVLTAVVSSLLTAIGLKSFH